MIAGVGIVGSQNRSQFFDGAVTTADYNFLYEKSAVKNPNYDLDDKVISPDGRTFYYAKAVNGEYFWRNHA
jgi:uncharacterized protein YfaP (DUF2135 family)